MIVIALLAIPTLSGIGTYFMTGDGRRRALLVLAAVLHAAWWLRPGSFPPAPIGGGWLRLDRLGQLS